MNEPTHQTDTETRVSSLRFASADGKTLLQHPPIYPLSNYMQGSHVKIGNEKNELVGVSLISDFPPEIRQDLKLNLEFNEGSWHCSTPYGAELLVRWPGHLLLIFDHQEKRGWRLHHTHSLNFSSINQLQLLDHLSSVGDLESLHKAEFEAERMTREGGEHVPLSLAWTYVALTAKRVGTAEGLKRATLAAANAMRLAESLPDADENKPHVLIEALTVAASLCEPTADSLQRALVLVERAMTYVRRLDDQGSLSGTAIVEVPLVRTDILSQIAQIDAAVWPLAHDAILKLIETARERCTRGERFQNALVLAHQEHFVGHQRQGEWREAAKAIDSAIADLPRIEDATNRLHWQLVYYERLGETLRASDETSDLVRALSAYDMGIATAQIIIDKMPSQQSDVVSCWYGKGDAWERLDSSKNATVACEHYDRAWSVADPLKKTCPDVTDTLWKIAADWTSLSLRLAEHELVPHAQFSARARVHEVASEALRLAAFWDRLGYGVDVPRLAKIMQQGGMALPSIEHTTLVNLVLTVVDPVVSEDAMPHFAALIDCGKMLIERAIDQCSKQAVDPFNSRFALPTKDKGAGCLDEAMQRLIALETIYHCGDQESLILLANRLYEEGRIQDVSRLWDSYREGHLLDVKRWVHCAKWHLGKDDVVASACLRFAVVVSPLYGASSNASLQPELISQLLDLGTTWKWEGKAEWTALTCEELDNDAAREEEGYNAAKAWLSEVETAYAELQNDPQQWADECFGWFDAPLVELAERGARILGDALANCRRRIDQFWIDQFAAYHQQRKLLTDGQLDSVKDYAAKVAGDRDTAEQLAKNALSLVSKVSAHLGISLGDLLARWIEIDKNVPDEQEREDAKARAFDQVLSTSRSALLAEVPHEVSTWFEARLGSLWQELDPLDRDRLVLARFIIQRGGPAPLIPVAGAAPGFTLESWWRKQVFDVLARRVREKTLPPPMAAQAPPGKKYSPDSALLQHWGIEQPARPITLGSMSFVFWHVLDSAHSKPLPDALRYLRDRLEEFSGHEALFDPVFQQRYGREDGGCHQLVKLRNEFIHNQVTDVALATKAMTLLVGDEKDSDGVGFLQTLLRVVHGAPASDHPSLVGDSRQNSALTV